MGDCKEFVLYFNLCSLTPSNKKPLLNPSLIKAYPHPLPKGRVALRLEIKAGDRLFLWDFYNKNTLRSTRYKNI